MSMRDGNRRRAKRKRGNIYKRTVFRGDQSIRLKSIRLIRGYSFDHGSRSIWEVFQYSVFVMNRLCHLAALVLFLMNFTVKHLNS
jgi:hypothetical protein